jgi:hypothetical protein
LRKWRGDGRKRLRAIANGLLWKAKLPKGAVDVKVDEKSAPHVPAASVSTRQEDARNGCPTKKKGVRRDALGDKSINQRKNTIDESGHRLGLFGALLLDFLDLVE